MPSFQGTRRRVVEVGVHGEVAVAAVPGGHRVAVDGVHLGVDGEEVVAALGAVLEDLVEEEAGGEPLALEPPLHVGEGQDDGVDLAARDEGAQLLDAERGLCGLPRESPPWVSREAIRYCREPLLGKGRMRDDGDG